MFRKVVKSVQEKTVKPLLLWYLRKDRQFQYEGLSITVLQGVFHPLFFYSTLILLDFLKKQDLQGKKLMEPGCGAGLVSVWAASKGAIVTAFDINSQAVVNTILNAEKNNLSLKCLHSNLFESISPEKFDFILINPPFYPKHPKSDSEFAWYCGSEFEYFENLFHKLAEYMNMSSIVVMVLSEDCQISRIRDIAKKNKLVMQQVSITKSLLETNYLFRIIL